MSVPSFFEIYSTANVLLLLSLEYCGLVDDVFLVATEDARQGRNNRLGQDLNPGTNGFIFLQDYFK